MNIDIKKLETIKKELDTLQTNQDALFIDENGETKYAIINVKAYDMVSDLIGAIDDEGNPVNAEVKVIRGDLGEASELSYEEYERVRTLIVNAVDKYFKPKAEKLN